METYDAVCLASIQDVMKVFKGKWAFLVIEELHIGTMRFNELARALDVSTKSLTDTLKNLEEHGVVARTVKPTVPVTVEYSLTEKGRAFDSVLLAMKKWRADWGEDGDDTAEGDGGTTSAGAAQPAAAAPTELAREEVHA